MPRSSRATPTRARAWRVAGRSAVRGSSGAEGPSRVTSPTVCDKRWTSLVDEPYITSRENDGATWTPYSGQTFADGPYRMAFDPIHRILYSANWNSGVWALKVR
jgi:hypothetical protein